MCMQDDAFEDGLESLLQDYAKPLADNCFSEAVMARTRKETRLRRYLLWGASLTGGLIASTQLPRLGALLGQLPRPNLSEFGSSQFDVKTLADIMQQNLSVSAGVGLMLVLGLWLASEALSRHI